MEFFDSISVAFCIFQCVCLSPFNLRNTTSNVMSQNIRRIFSSAVISIQLLVMVLCLIFVNQFVYWKRAKQIKVVDTITMALVQFTALVIFCESYKKRAIQNEFLHKINTIDFILEYKIGIILNYAEQKKIHERRLIWWLIISLLIFIVNLVVAYSSFEILYRWWIIVYASFLICSLRCFQIIVYAQIIRDRYCQLNKYMNSLPSHGGNHQNVNFNHKKMINNVCTIFKSTNSTSDHEQLLDLQRVCRLLSEVNRCVNEMFRWSIPLIVVNGFVHIIVNSYWILRIILSTKAPFKFLITPLLWTFLNLNNVIWLSSVCHFATKEVFAKLSA